MCYLTQALHSELIGRKQDVNQMCLSLAVQPTAMEVQSNIETATGERLILSVLRPPRGTFNFFVGFSFMAQEFSVMFHKRISICYG